MLTYQKTKQKKIKNRMKFMEGSLMISSGKIS